MRGVTMDEEMDTSMKKFMGGMKRMVAKEKRDNIILLAEGKKAMSFNVY